MTRRPAVILFDVVETLLSLGPVQAALGPLGLSLDLYFARLLRDEFALAAAGDYRPFGEIAVSALVALAPAATEEHRARVQQASASCRPIPTPNPHSQSSLPPTSKCAP